MSNPFSFGAAQFFVPREPMGAPGAPLLRGGPDGAPGVGWGGCFKCVSGSGDGAQRSEFECTLRLRLYVFLERADLLESP